MTLPPYLHSIPVVALFTVPRPMIQEEQEELRLRLLTDGVINSKATQLWSTESTKMGNIQ